MHFFSTKIQSLHKTHQKQDNMTLTKTQWMSQRAKLYSEERLYSLYSKEENFCAKSLKGNFKRLTLIQVEKQISKNVSSSHLSTIQFSPEALKSKTCTPHYEFSHLQRIFVLHPGTKKIICLDMAAGQCISQLGLSHQILAPGLNSNWTSS